MPNFETWGPEEWTVVARFVGAFAQVILAVGALIGGVWAVITYSRNRRFQAANWLKDLFKDVYLNDYFNKARSRIEYNFMEEVAPVLQKRITNRSIPTNEREQNLLLEIDNFLNMFEVILYLRGNRQIKRSDMFSVFRYWFYDLIKREEHALLRSYILEFHFKSISDYVDEAQQEHDYIFVYGLFREKEFQKHWSDCLDFEKAKPAVARGSIYHAKANSPVAKRTGGETRSPHGFPFLIYAANEDDPSYGVVHGEAVPIRKGMRHRILQRMDDQEGYRPNEEADCPLIRRRIRVRMPRPGVENPQIDVDKHWELVDAWLYIFNRYSAQFMPTQPIFEDHVSLSLQDSGPDSYTKILKGDWISYLETLNLNTGDYRKT